MTTYSYDASGHPLTKRQAAAGTLFDLNYDYDSAGRLRHGHKSLAYEDDFHFLTLHGRSPARRGVELDPATRLRPKLAPRKWPYCSSIAMSRMRFCGMAFLPRLLTDLFLEQVA